MSSSNVSRYIWPIYSISFLISLAVLALSLLDLGFGSLFLGIIGPIVTFVHHGCSAFILRRPGTNPFALVTSTPSIITVALLFVVWLAGSIVVTVWASFYIKGTAQIATQVVGSPGTVMAQGVVGIMESVVLLLLLATLIRTRWQQKSAEPIEGTKSHRFNHDARF